MRIKMFMAGINKSIMDSWLYIMFLENTLKVDKFGNAIRFQ